MTALLPLCGIALGFAFIGGMVYRAKKRRMPTDKEYADFENEKNKKEALHVKPLRRGNP